MPPAWYPDPAVPGLLRWWDGYGWTQHTQPVAGIAPQPMAGPYPAQDLADESKWGRLAGHAVLVASVVTAVQQLLSVFVVRDFTRYFREVVHAIDQANGGPTPVVSFHPNRMLTSTSQVMSLVTFAAGVVFLLWFHKAATIAQRLGLPARRRPAWAVLGFIIPIVNLWFPYQVARDLFPPGDLGRSTVKLWWGLYLGMGIAAIPMLVAAFFSTTVAVLLVVVPGTMAVAAALAARRMITEVGRAHAQLLMR
jgi:hypothetical protein